MSSRLNDMQNGAKVIIMQRLHQDDLAGHVLEQGGYEHLCLPSEFELERRCSTSIGWADPRTAEDEVLFAALFPKPVLEQAKKDLGVADYAGQHQQRPSPAEGGILKRHWWRYWRRKDVALPMVKVHYWKMRRVAVFIGWLTQKRNKNQSFRLLYPVYPLSMPHLADQHLLREESGEHHRLLRATQTTELFHFSQPILGSPFARQNVFQLGDVFGALIAVQNNCPIQVSITSTKGGQAAVVITHSTSRSKNDSGLLASRSRRHWLILWCTVVLAALSGAARADTFTFHEESIEHQGNTFSEHGSARYLVESGLSYPGYGEIALDLVNDLNTHTHYPTFDRMDVAIEDPFGNVIAYADSFGCGDFSACNYTFFFATGGTPLQDIPDIHSLFTRPHSSIVENGAVQYLMQTTWDDGVIATIQFQSPAAVPEPSSLLLLGTIVLGLGLGETLRRVRKPAPTNIQCYNSQRLALPGQGRQAEIGPVAVEAGGGETLGVGGLLAQHTRRRLVISTL